MNLSFPSVPTLPESGAVLNGQGAGVTPGLAAESSGGAEGGFADMLAGVTPAPVGVAAMPVTGLPAQARFAMSGALPGALFTQLAGESTTVPVGAMPSMLAACGGTAPATPVEAGATEVEESTETASGEASETFCPRRPKVLTVAEASDVQSFMAALTAMAPGPAPLPTAATFTPAAVEVSDEELPAGELPLEDATAFDTSAWGGRTALARTTDTGSNATGAELIDASTPSAPAGAYESVAAPLNRLVQRPDASLSVTELQVGGNGPAVRPGDPSRASDVLIAATVPGNAPGASSAVETTRRLPRSVAVSSPSTPVLEKIAARAAVSAAGSDGVRKVESKTFVAAEQKELTYSQQALGIDSAKPAATMADVATQARFTASGTPEVSAGTLGDVSDRAATVPAPVEVPATAHKAVEAVLSTVERFAARDKHSVSLQFTVGGSDLNVRVEMRAGEVHTTFRTDSSDLRAALANEWQAVTSQNDRPVKLANPVFAGAHDAATSFSGDSAAQDRRQDSGASRSSMPGSENFRIGSSRTTAAAATTAAAPVRTVAANSVHLHTLA